MSQFGSGDTTYRSFVRGVTDYAIVMLDSDGLIRTWNAGAERIKGYEAAEVVGRHFSMLYTEEDRVCGLPGLSLDLARLEGRAEHPGWRLRKDGSSFWASAVIDAIWEDGRLVGFTKITRDCTEQRAQAVALETMARNLRLALAFLPKSACLLDAENRIVLFNPAFQELFASAEIGLELHEVVGHRAWREGLRLADVAAVLSDIRNAPETTPCDIVLGTLTLAIEKRSAGGEGWVLSVEDVTEQRAAERVALHSAHHDPLTGLANRDGLDEHLDASLAACSGGEGCAVLYLDLDGFGLLNDTLGHQAGDAFLKETAGRILHVLRPEDFASRLGGDEFVVVPSAPISADNALRVAERLKAKLEQPFLHEGRCVQVGASIGVAVSRAQEASGGELIGRADLALYQAKRDGGNRVRLFDQELGIAALKRRTMEFQLGQALKAEEFSLVYQPICAAGTGAIKGFEALLRWRKADGTSVPPAEFIPVAEELDIMSEIGAWVLETACREAASWPPNITLSVNVSPKQMHDPKLLDRIEAALSASGLGADRLEIEITETAMIIDHALTLAVLTRIRALGVAIAIDDFGTGYSSLSFLHSLPFTRVKIDRSFVADILENPNSVAIVRGVMRMSHELGLRVTAEGVETEAQRNLLHAEACQDLQGYLFARPMAGTQVQEFLAAAATPSAAKPASR